MPIPDGERGLGSTAEAYVPVPGRRGKRPDPDSIWRQGGNRAGEEQFGELAGQGSQQQRGERGRRQGVDRAHQDDRGPGIPGRE